MHAPTILLASNTQEDISSTEVHPNIRRSLIHRFQISGAKLVDSQTLGASSMGGGGRPTTIMKECNTWEISVCVTTRKQNKQEKKSKKTEREAGSHTYRILQHQTVFQLIPSP